MIRIKLGEADVFKKLKDAFVIKEAYQVQLEKAESDVKNEQVQKEISENVPPPYEK